MKTKSPWNHTSREKQEHEDGGHAVSSPGPGGVLTNTKVVLDETDLFELLF